MGTSIVLDDFNLGYLKDTFYVSQYKRIIRKIAQPTRIAVNSSTLIDHVSTDAKSIQWQACNTPAINDHSMIKILLNNEYSLYKQPVVSVGRK